MTQKIAIRSGRDRLRYALVFEASLMLVLIPAGALFYERPLLDIGMLGVILSTKAMIISLAYNWVFDRVDAKAGRVSSSRSTVGRVLHALGFELSLLTTSLPIYMWWLGIGPVEAVMTDMVVTTFVVTHTYLFTLAYDRMFPVGDLPLANDNQLAR